MAGARVPPSPVDCVKSSETAMVLMLAPGEWQCVLRMVVNVPL